MKTCTIDDCYRRHLARGYCGAHYNRWKRHGDPLGLTYRPGPDVAEGEKWCRRCDSVKSVEDFGYSARARDGKRGMCKECNRAATAEWAAANQDKVVEYRRANKEHFREYYAEYRRLNAERERERHERYRAENSGSIREYQKANPHKFWESGYRQRAKKFGFAPSVEAFTRDDLIGRWGDACYLCGGDWDQLEHVTPVSRGGEHSLSNCRPVCEPCNRRAWAEYLRAETA